MVAAGRFKSAVTTLLSTFKKAKVSRVADDVKTALPDSTLLGSASDLGKKTDAAKEILKDAGAVKADKDAITKGVEDIKTKDLSTPSKVRDAAGDFSKNFDGKAAVGAAVVGLVAYAFFRAQISSAVDRTITAAENDGADLKLTFTPALEILEADTISISGSPIAVLNSIQGISIKKNISDTQILIGGKNIPSGSTCSNPCGTIDVTSTTAGQLTDITASVLKDVLPSANIFLSYWWVFVILIVILSSSSAGAMLMSSSR